MIEAQVIFGEDAIARFEETGKVPTDYWLSKHGGVVDTVEFKTMDEYNAYNQALNDVDGWHGSHLLSPKVIPKDCSYCKEWRGGL